MSLVMVGCGSGAAQDPATSSEGGEEPLAAAEHATSEGNFNQIYAQGITFAAFLDAADQRRQTWHDNYDQARVPTALLQQARALPGSWRVLVMAEDWCGDSANTIPYLARLLEQLDNVELRIVNSEVGASLGEAHPTPDGRSATPTVVVLDDQGQDAGCWVERPAELQRWFLGESVANVADDALYARKYAWYDWDVGESTMSEVIQVLEGAAAGTPICN